MRQLLRGTHLACDLAMRSTLAIGLLCVSLLTACKGTTGPTSISQGIDLTGTWSGDITVQGLSARMTWTLTQTSTSVIGPAVIVLPNGVVLLNGTVNGTLANSTLTYTITIVAGGIPTQPSCSGQLGGTLTATVATTSTLTGNYSVTSSTCVSPLPGGNLTLTKQ